MREHALARIRNIGFASHSTVQPSARWHVCDLFAAFIFHYVFVIVRSHTFFSSRRRMNLCCAHVIRCRLPFLFVFPRPIVSSTFSGLFFFLLLFPLDSHFSIPASVLPHFSVDASFLRFVENHRRISFGMRRKCQRRQ